VRREEHKKLHEREPAELRRKAAGELGKAQKEKDNEVEKLCKVIADQALELLEVRASGG
jgi:hypothetical protein